MNIPLNHYKIQGISIGKSRGSQDFPRTSPPERTPDLVVILEGSDFVEADGGRLFRFLGMADKRKP